MVRASGAYRVLQEAGTGVRVCIYIVVIVGGWVLVVVSPSREGWSEREIEREKESAHARARNIQRKREG